MNFLLPREYRKNFKKYRAKHERDWVETAQFIKDIKENENWTEFQSENYEDFLNNFFWYEKENDDKMIKAFDYLMENHPKLMEENSIEYVPPFKYIEYIYKKKKELTEKQIKEMDKWVFAGWDKKSLRGKLKEFLRLNETIYQKRRNKVKIINRLRNTMEDELVELKKLYDNDYSLIDKILSGINSVKDSIKRLLATVT